MLVQQILNAKESMGVVTIAPDALVSAAANLLSSKRIGAVVVSDDGEKLEGILSERDIVRELGKRGAKCLRDPVGSMMTRELVVCSPGDSADNVLTMMTEARCRHLPVRDGGRTVGLISIGDVVKARLSELSMEKDALEGMIMGH